MVKSEDAFFLLGGLEREQKGLDIEVETWVTQINTKLGLCVCLLGKRFLFSF